MARYRCPNKNHQLLVDYRPQKAKGLLSKDHKDWLCPRPKCGIGFMGDAPPPEYKLPDEIDSAEAQDDFERRVLEAQTQIDAAAQDGMTAEELILRRAQAVTLANINDTAHREQASSVGLSALRALGTKAKAAVGGSKAKTADPEETLEDAILRYIGDAELDPEARKDLAKKILSKGE